MSVGGWSPSVVVFTGLPGSGKSTLAEGLASASGSPVFSGDWLMGALKPANKVLTQLDGESYVKLHDGLLEMLMARQLMFRQAAIVDGVVSDAVLRRWQEIASGYGAELHVIECICSDAGEHRRRVEGRVRGIPGWHEIDWDHVERMRGVLKPLETTRLTLDAMDPVELNLRRAQDYISRSEAHEH
jgi:adenylate kinase family enzyme